MENKIDVGIRVLVPFGKGNRKKIAVIIRIDEVTNEDLSKFKPISSIIDDESLLNEEMLDLIIWIRNTTLCTYFDAFRTLIPIGLSVNLSTEYLLADNSELNEALLTPDASNLLQKIKADFSIIENSEKKIIDELIQAGFITEKNLFKRKKKDDTVKMIRFTEEYLNGKISIKPSVKQNAVISLIEESTTASIKEITYICGVTTSVINNLIQKKVLESYEYEVIQSPNIDAVLNVDDIVLNNEQTAAFKGITELINKQKADVALLYGVTGSGKTSVFLKTIKHTLDMGRNVIMLIPEISLTPQVVDKFQSYFGNLVAIMHSNLSLTQRLNEYKRVKSGQARIVVGTRSAVFAPLENIGLFIIDEEGEHTYKSESSPRYNAKEIAKKRCLYHNALVLMASATPSVESFYYANTGRYKLFEIEKRYSQQVLPTVEMVDLGTDGFYGNSTIFSERLVEEINYNLEKKEQIILLLNRRGYHTYINCSDCKEPLMCPNCSIPLTYHKTNGRLICHYCDYNTEMTKSCPNCNSEHLRLTGIGTQKVEDEITSLFPNARILRMDADTTYSRYAYEKNFKAFENKEYDIMLGTQMIAKGLDFPDVTLVGVLSIDKSLFSGDFRSYERTFSLITQVVGRCGRGQKQGRALIQTYVPEHYVINLAAEQNYKAFYEQEIISRKALVYPPFCDICVIEFSSPIEKCADTASKLFLGLISNSIKSGQINVPIRVLGPTKCIYEKINGKYRYRIIIKCKNNQMFRDYIGNIYKIAFKMKEFSNVQTTLDINGDIGL